MRCKLRAMTRKIVSAQLLTPHFAASLYAACPVQRQAVTALGYREGEAIMPDPAKSRRAEFQGDLFEAGFEVRSRVMGGSYAARAVDSADSLAAPLQKLVTEAAWGMVWTREELGLRERSIATVAMLAALGREEELRGHLRGARNNGLSAVQLREIVMQVCIYAGFPTGLAAFRTLREVLEAEDGAS
jgi:4-carboxymuconolactone decarboxylase